MFKRNQRINMPKDLKIVNWNCRSIFSNQGEFQNFLDNSKPHLVGLTETWLKPNKSIKFKGYDVIRRDRVNGLGGGVAVLISRELTYEVVNLHIFRDGNMDCVGVKVQTTGSPISFLFCYSPPGNLSLDELDHYCNYFGGDLILGGDFNARHPSWDSGASNQAGTILDDMVTNSNNLALFTPKDLNTRFNASNNTDSTIDLFIGSSRLQPYCEVTKEDIIGSSDHYPVILHVDLQPQWTPIKFRGRWVIDKSTWPKWVLMLQTLTLIWRDSVEDCIGELTSKLTGVAKNVFRHSSGLCSPKCSAPWWNVECQNIKKEKRRLKQILRRHFSIENMNNYKRAAAEFKRTIKRTRKKYWRDYCTTLTSESTMDQIWKVFNSMKKRQPPDTYPLESNDFLTAFEKTEIFADHFYSIYNDTISIENEELLHQHVLSAIRYCHNAYNIPFKMSELRVVTGNLPNNKAAGMDDIPYEFIRNLDPISESFLLRIYNDCWSNSIFPATWKNAIVLPFQKPGKDPSYPVSYRPISLLSTFGKVFERLVFNRLYWFLENNFKLPEFHIL